MSSYGSQSTTYDPQIHDQKYYNPQPQPGALVPHPQQQRRHSSNSHLQPYYQQPPYQHYPQQQPPYERQYSHQSHHSHHSCHSHKYDDDRYEDDRDLERRPTIGDTLTLIWGTVVGAITGRRR